jgi:signal peptidase II
LVALLIAIAAAKLLAFMRKYLLLTSALIVVLDCLTKWVVQQNLPLYGEVEVIPGFLRLTHLENPGAAFSLFADSPGPWAGRLLLVFSLAALVVISVLLWRNSHLFNLTLFSLALFLGGTIGNLLDRLIRGRVTDFIDFYIGPHHWPPFNVADSAIVIGALILAGNAIFGHSEKKVESA